MFQSIFSLDLPSKTCVKEPPSRLTLNSGWCGKSWLSYKGTCHVILLAKLHEMYLYKTTTFPHQPLRSISKVAVLHRFYCTWIYLLLELWAITGSQCSIWLPYYPIFPKYFSFAGLGGSVGCAVRLETRRSWVQHPPRSATFFRGDWSWNIFYGHSLPSADSRRAVVSFWRKNVHNTG